jgi:hypothetical protein
LGGSILFFARGLIEIGPCFTGVYPAIATPTALKRQKNSTSPLTPLESAGLGWKKTIQSLHPLFSLLLLIDEQPIAYLLPLCCRILDYRPSVFCRTAQGLDYLINPQSPHLTYLEEPEARDLILKPVATFPQIYHPPSINSITDSKTGCR